MPKTRCRLVYQFDELDDAAKDKARDWYREHALDYDWWEYTYDDAERAGLKITEFDLDRNKHVKGSLTMTAAKSIAAIFADHGNVCDTFKMAEQFSVRLNRLNPESEDYESDIEELTEEYEHALCEEYASILQAEYEYQLSDEQVDESIKANEYEFTEEGTRYR